MIAVNAHIKFIREQFIETSCVWLLLETLTKLLNDPYINLPHQNWSFDNVFGSKSYEVVAD